VLNTAHLRWLLLARFLNQATQLLLRALLSIGQKPRRRRWSGGAARRGSRGGE
jgi:hypothetical protein